MTGTGQVQFTNEEAHARAPPRLKYKHLPFPFSMWHKSVLSNDQTRCLKVNHNSKSDFSAVCCTSDATDYIIEVEKGDWRLFSMIASIFSDWPRAL